MEDNTDGKKNTIPTIPANYVSILDLKERWLKEKERKRNEEEERRRKQQVEEEEKIKEDLKKAEEVRRQLEKEKRLNRSNRGRNGWKKDGGEAKFAEKEVFVVTTAIGNGGGEETAEGLPEKDRGFRRKRYKKKKKIPDCACGSIPPPKNVVTENNITPVKGEKSTGKKSVKYREKVVKDDAKTTKAIETKIENLSIKNLKSQTRSSNVNRTKQGNDSVVHQQQRVRKQIGSGAGSMVWVKKDKANDGIASGVKPFNA